MYARITDDKISRDMDKLMERRKEISAGMGRGFYRSHAYAAVAVVDGRGYGNVFRSVFPVFPFDGQSCVVACVYNVSILITRIATVL